MNKFILTLSCPDKIGIVAEVSGFLAAHECNITESAQFNDSFNDKFFMRVVFESKKFSLPELQNQFASIHKKFAMASDFFDTTIKPRVLLLVSKSGHCLNHILHRRRVGSLAIDVPAVVSNHGDLEEMAKWHKIPYYHMPVGDDNRPKQEEEILGLVEDLEIDLVVLARYMQVLSNKTSAKLAGRAINIHHSFLPSFKGANPYKQAFERGVKIIGATAHYITDDLDEGPIIEQEVIRVDHNMTPEQLVAAGSDIENLVLARAIQYHTEHRVLLDGNKKIIFK